MKLGAWAFLCGFLLGILDGIVFSKYWSAFRRTT